VVYHTQHGGYIAASFGTAGDIPVVMNPDADNTSNIGVLRPSNNTWYIATTLIDPAHNFTATPWGQSGDILVPADYDGDNKEDVAIFRPSNGTWYVRQSSNGALAATQFGANGDIPVPGDYDGDGRDDQAVYRLERVPETARVPVSQPSDSVSHPTPGAKGIHSIAAFAGRRAVRCRGGRRSYQQN